MLSALIYGAYQDGFSLSDLDASMPYGCLAAVLSMPLALSDVGLAFLGCERSPSSSIKSFCDLKEVIGWGSAGASRFMLGIST